jgi:hypothetical protein
LKHPWDKGTAGFSRQGHQVMALGNGRRRFSFGPGSQTKKTGWTFDTPKSCAAESSSIAQGMNRSGNE